MFEKLEALEEKYEELNLKLSDPAVISDQATFQKLAKNHSDLQEIVQEFRSYKAALQDLEAAEELLEEEQDPDMAAMLKEEISNLEDKVEQLKQRLRILLLPKDPNDEKNVIVEIRGGTGGDEAALLLARSLECTAAMRRKTLECRAYEQQPH